MMTPDAGGGLGQRWIIYLVLEGFGFAMSIGGRDARGIAGETPRYSFLAAACVRDSRARIIRFGLGSNPFRLDRRFY